MTTTSDLYYECHITLEPVFGDELDRLRGIVHVYGFRVADLLMKRNREATPTRSEFDTFCTTRGRNYDDIVWRAQQCLLSLKLAGFDVWRWKVEDTLLDVRLRGAPDPDDNLIGALL